MRVLCSKTGTGVARELLAFELVYNMIRSVMTVIAIQLETTPSRVSLIDTLRPLRQGLTHITSAAIVLDPDRPADSSQG